MVVFATPGMLHAGKQHIYSFFLIQIIHKFPYSNISNIYFGLRFGLANTINDY